MEIITGLAIWLPSLFLHFVRVGAFFVGQPLFGIQSESKMLRVILMVSLGSIFFWVNGAPIVEVSSITAYGLLVAREALIGFGIGLATKLMTAALATAGEILSHEMGFAMAQIVDPATGRSSPVISQLFETSALLLMFELNVHHDVLYAVGYVYEILPVGSGFDIAPVTQRLASMVSDSLTFGMRYAIPVLGVMVLLTAVLVMLARAVQNINLLEFTFGLRILLALLSSVYFLTEGTPFLEHMFGDLIGKTRMLFEGV